MLPKTNQFCRYVEGGMGSVSMAIGNAAREAGAHIVTSAGVYLLESLLSLWMNRTYSMKFYFDLFVIVQLHRVIFMNMNLTKEKKIGFILVTVMQFTL